MKKLLVVLLLAVGCRQAGQQGPQGIPGPPADPGTVVTVVQFCKGYTTTYPAVFPEFGLCINNQIYAVFWDKTNAWQALIPPGYYSSTSTSAPCSFTVLDNCGIQN